MESGAEALRIEKPWFASSWFAGSLRLMDILSKKLKIDGILAVTRIYMGRRWSRVPFVRL